MIIVGNPWPTQYGPCNLTPFRFGNSLGSKLCSHPQKEHGEKPLMLSQNSQMSIPNPIELGFFKLHGFPRWFERLRHIIEQPSEKLNGKRSLASGRSTLGASDGSREGDNSMGRCRGPLVKDHDIQAYWYLLQVFVVWPSHDWSTSSMVKIFTP